MACWLRALLIVLAISLVPLTAAAQPVDPKVRNAARSLGADGMRLYAQKKYRQALDRFERADKLLPTPTLAIRAARCLEKLGRLIEASERYLSIIRSELEAGAHWSHRQAKRDALRERDAIMPRIAKLAIMVDGPRGDGIIVRIDNERVPLEVVDVPGPVDPGEHVVEVERADTTVYDKITIGEGKTERVTLVLPKLPPPPPPPVPVVDEELEAWRTAGIVAGAIGIGGALMAIGNGVAALVLESDLEDRCPNRDCPPDAHGDADMYDATRVLTTVGMVLGGVGLAAGGVMLFTEPWLGLNQDEEADVALTVSSNGLSLRGSF